MSPRPLFGLLALALCLPAPRASHARPGGERGGDPPGAKKPADIHALIDKLVEVGAPGIGYSPYVTGRGFLPLESKGRVSVGILGVPPPAPSETLRSLVKQGAAAVPHLIAHLDDRRKTRLRVGLGPTVGMLSFMEDIDFNGRTERPAAIKPEGGKKADPPSRAAGPYTLTVGDLCYVALGQIVNRGNVVVGYIPSGIVVVSAPARSAAMREAVKRSWGGLTLEKHRASLIADFQKPDGEPRRIGACKRLAYYYPDALEPLVLKFLAEPTYSEAAVAAFVIGKLSPEKEPERRRALFDAYLAEHGDLARDGILLWLFRELRAGGREEEVRGLLQQLYEMPKTVKAEDRPPVWALSVEAKARFIEEALLYDDSVKIDRAVRRLLVGAREHQLAEACIRRLIGRGYDKEIEAYCRHRLAGAREERDKRPVRAILDKLGWTPLHVAVDRNQLDRVRELLWGKAKVDAAARNGQTALHVASGAGHQEAVTLLVEAGASLDPKDEAGQTPAQRAARGDHAEVVRLLSGRGCAVPDILVASLVGDAGRARQILKADRAAHEQQTEHEFTPLHLAAWQGHTEVAKVLLAHGADVQALGWYSLQPLHIAAAVGSEGVTRELIRAGASVRAPWSKKGPQPLHLAAQNGHPKVAALLLDAGAPVDAWVEDVERVTPLHLAASAGHAAVIDLLVKRKAVVETRDGDERTPLHRAASEGRPKAAERLLAARADVNAKDGLEKTPLHLAVSARSKATVELLLAHKADVLAKSLLGETPLEIAEQLKEEEIVKVLRGALPKE